jgi:hypothetical protein
MALYIMLANLTDDGRKTVKEKPERTMEFNIEELRKQKRPLWMTGFGVESPADLLGGGGDIHTDRLPVDSARSAGEEVFLTVEGSA